MGIPNLQNLLVPHAQALVLPHSSVTESCTPTTSPSASNARSSSNQEDKRKVLAVIDGPGLAYHALHLARLDAQARLGEWWQWRAQRCKQQDPTVASSFTRRSRALRNVLTATPSYRAVAAAMLAWINALKCHGIHVGALLFDGALPDVKREIRLGRMGKLLVKLQHCRESFIEEELELDEKDTEATLNIRLAMPSTEEKNQQQKLAKSSEKSNQTFLERLAASGRVASNHNHATDFPPPIFLVAAMLECLRADPEYANITCMVSGEADPYCAAHAQKLAMQHPDASVLILTSDSDLFAYDLRDNVSIVLFKDVSVSRFGDQCQSELHAQAYCPSRIARQFGLESLSPFAFSVHHDRYRSLSTHLAEARRAENNVTAACQSFRLQYQLPDFEVKSLDCSSAFQKVDTKVSEFIHAFLECANHNADGLSPTMYLPSGHEDAQRASMWSYGANLRQLAYSIMLRSKPFDIDNVIERYRKGNRTGETHVPILSLADTEKQIRDLDLQLKEATTAIAGGDTPKAAVTWRIICLWFLCQTLLEQGKSVPGKTAIMQIYKGHPVPSTWLSLHIQAQWHAILDSWRILLQCIAVHLEIAPADLRITSVMTLLELAKDIGRNSIRDMFDPLPHKDEKELGMLKLVIDRMFASLGVVEQQSADDAKKSKRKRRAKHRQSREPSSTGSSRTKTDAIRNNMFSLLAEDDSA